MRAISAIFTLFAILATISCTKERVAGGSGALLRITPGTEVPVKSIVCDSNISEREIGLQITNYTGISFYEGLSSIENLKLLRPIPGGPWEFRDQNNLPVEIKVYEDSAKIHAYYPYTPEHVQGIGSLAKMDIDIPAAQTYGQVSDYLWGCQDKTLPEGGFSINSRYPEVFLRLNHSLSMVAFVFYKSGYTGEGRVTSVEMRSKTANNIFRANKSEPNDLKMSLSNGGITGGSMVSALSLTGIDALITLDAKPEETPADLFANKNFHMLLVPANILQREDVELSFVIDGETYTSPLPGAGALNFTPGNASIFIVKLSPNLLKITGVADWNLVSYEVSSGYDDLWYGMQPVQIGNLLWAPVNVGYDPVSNPYGLMFQWHRKYGQIFGTTTLTTGPVDLSTGNDPANSLKFYTRTISPYDWCISTQSLWDMAESYNPCPIGWRVPTSAEMILLKQSGSTWVNAGEGGVANLAGMWFGGNHSTDRTGSVFLPAGGLIMNSGTSVSRTIYRGYYHATDVISESPYELYLSSSLSEVRHAGTSKSSGKTIRCVKTIL
ncbi:MAG: fimbrillin family protein [Bacteroidales bacterium]|jgi:uncharacterized protein (TIGR02145 family)|nr:fimbrillin family protein [Bacteroidales bacterium]